MSKIGDHAVVLGASMAGLLSARVLADAYRRVTIVERDPLPTGEADRKGVPQGRHAHALLPRGAQVLDELFPGLLEEMVADGVPVTRSPRQWWFRFSGHVLCRVGGPEEPGYQPSRPYLEVLRRERGPGPPPSPHRRPGRSAPSTRTSAASTPPQPPTRSSPASSCASVACSPRRQPC